PGHSRNPKASARASDSMTPPTRIETSKDSTAVVQCPRLDRSGHFAAHSARSIFRNTRVLAIGVLLEQLQTFRFRPYRPMEINSQMTLRFRTDPVFLNNRERRKSCRFPAESCGFAPRNIWIWPSLVPV